jgi:hypothetical protein
MKYYIAIILCLSLLLNVITGCSPKPNDLVVPTVPVPAASDLLPVTEPKDLVVPTAPVPVASDLLPVIEPIVTFPAHKITYASGHLKGEKGEIPVLKTAGFNLSIYPKLNIRKGFALQEIVYGRGGGELLRYLVAIHLASQEGFVLEPGNGIQGGFLFAPIENATQAFEYVKLMVHATPVSMYGRFYTYISSDLDFDRVLNQLRELSKKDPRSTLETANTPPTKATRSTRQPDGKYLVELVLKGEIPRQSIQYLAYLVGSDGRLELKESFVLIEGPPRAALP